MFSVTRRLGVATLLGLAIMAGSMAPAGATTVQSGATARAATTLPNVNIGGSPVVFAPTTLSVPASPSGTCSSTTAGFTVTNTTSTMQVVLYKGKKFSALKKGSFAYVCVYGSVGGKVQFGLKNSTSKLKVTIS